MCRWLAYLGSPITLDTVLTRPDHSLVDQSLMARELQVNASPIARQFPHHDFPTNGDGYGVGWFGTDGRTGLIRETTPAWDSKNLPSVAPFIESGCFLSHVRAAPGGSITIDNCHPFVHGGWMYQYNGDLNGFDLMRRDLMMDVDPKLFPFIQGNADTEVTFYLALTYGLADDPVGAITRMIQRVEKGRRDHNVAGPFRACIGAADGDRIIAVRYSSPDAGDDFAPTLYHSSGPISLHTQAGDAEQLPEDTQLIVSEPLELHFSRRTWHAFELGEVVVLERGKEPVVTQLSL